MNKLKDFWEFHQTLTLSFRILIDTVAIITLTLFLWALIASKGILLIIILALAFIAGVMVLPFFVHDKYRDYKRGQHYKNRGW